MPVLDPKRLVENRVNAIREYHREAGVQKAELDLSGGIDSAVMACLLTMALGPQNVILVHSRFKTSSEQTARARKLAEGLEVPLIDFDGGRVWDVLINDMETAILNAYGSACKEFLAASDANPVIKGSIRSCLRAPIGRGFNRMLGGGIRHGTGNECEDRFLRFYQKGGDGEVDTNPIEILSKTEVYQLAFQLGKELPEVQSVLTATIKATPSPDLWGNGNGHTDEAELLAMFGVPFTYGRINPETGEIVSIGTIERISRFLDDDDFGEDLFITADESLPNTIFPEAFRHPAFKGLSETQIVAFLMAARKAESATQHKSNINIPTLGTREDLVKTGILTNNLNFKEN